MANAQMYLTLPSDIEKGGKQNRKRAADVERAVRLKKKRIRCAAAPAPLADHAPARVADPAEPEIPLMSTAATHFAGGRIYYDKI